MATITTHKLVDHLRKFDVRGVQVDQITFDNATDLANDTDDISLVDIPPGFAVVNAALHVSATLGAGCTLTLRAGTTALTGASTAAAASTVVQDVIDTPSATAARTLNLLVGGADIAASATIVVQYGLVPVERRTVPIY